MSHDTATPGQISQQQTEKVTLLSASINITLSILQVIVGWLAHSQALIADGIHTLSDLIADAIVLLANRKSRQAADADHPYGHARYENAASLALGLILLMVGGGMLFSAIRKILSPELIAVVHSAALWMALIALIAKESLFRYMLHVARRLNSSMLTANAWHARSDAASSLIVAAGIIGNLAGYPVFDPLAALLVGLMILRIGGSIAWRALHDLMDHALPDEDITTIRDTLAATPGVLNVHDLRTRRMGDSGFVDVHIEVSPRSSVTEGHYIAVEAQRRVLARHAVSEVLVHIDPPDEENSMQPGMPQRADIESALTPVLTQYGQQGWYCILHYLEGLLEVVIILPQPITKEQKIRLINDLQAVLGMQVKIRLLLQI